MTPRDTQGWRVLFGVMLVALAVLPAVARGEVRPPTDSGGPAAKPPAWPPQRDGLVFLWEDGSRANEVLDPVTKKIRACRAEPRGTARFGRFYVMDLKGGAFVAEGADETLLAECQRTGELSLEALITPAALDPKGPARIVSFSSGDDSCNFMLGQEGDRLVFRLRTGAAGAAGPAPPIDLAPLAAGKPQHLVVTYQHGRLACYLDGRPVLTRSDLQGDFGAWSPQHLLFGDEWTGGHTWAGQLEGIAIYGRRLGPDEVREHWRLYKNRLEGRRPAERLRVQARLLEMTTTPDPRTLDVYRRALVVHQYVVEKVLEGRCESPRILVAHWAILDLKVLPREWKKGETYFLALERFADHPELEPERQFRDFGAFDWPLYYEVGP